MPKKSPRAVKPKKETGVTLAEILRALRSAGKIGAYYLAERIEREGIR